MAITGVTIAEIGRVTGGAATVIDAADLVIAPGFMDSHTHDDAQVGWDGAVTPSSWHGGARVIMGHCAVGLVLCKPTAREVAMRDPVNVAAIPERHAERRGRHRCSARDEARIDILA